MRKTIEVISTEFIPIAVKVDLVNKLEQGDKETIYKVIHEMERLESIIRDYEITFNQINQKQESRIFKSPENI